ncbi:MAG TPA: peptidoglycan-binding protein [Ilumatobacter sp.]|jgi:peptidoglycan hydrolase-like protein with peptidoglycan-binding domain|nr:peptidoglycan-binding protein [Ilumatobacter sp.]
MMRDLAACLGGRSRRRNSRLVAVVTTVALLAAACSDDDDDVATIEPAGVTEAPEPTEAPEDPVAAAQQQVTDAEDGVSEAQDALTTAHGEFCSATEGYVETLDRYGRVFTDREATVGDINTLGADLTEPRDEVVSAADGVDTAKDDLAAAQQELVDAQAALAAAIATASSVPNSTATPTTSTTTTLVPPATIERVEEAENDLARTARGITDETPLVEAAAEYNSAALALEMAWLRLLAEAQCLTDEQHANAAEQITAYTTGLQTDLTTGGYDPGPIDGVYGPKTVAAVEQLQTDSELPVTGFVDEATARALQEKLAAVGQEEARQTVVLQTILSLVGFWDAPIDGVWSEELTQALMDFQTELGVEPTGDVDAATIAAFQQALANLEAGTPSTTNAPAPTNAPTEPPAATTAAPEGEAAVLLADSDLGQIVTAANGMTVYLFIPDAQSDPTCTDACAEAWPPLTVDDAGEVTGGEGVDEALLGTAEHPAGTQATYNGWPLYFFSGDATPGDTNGQGQGDVWYALDATGNPISD